MHKISRVKSDNDLISVSLVTLLGQIPKSSPFIVEKIASNPYTKGKKKVEG